MLRHLPELFLLKGTGDAGIGCLLLLLKGIECAFCALLCSVQVVLEQGGATGTCAGTPDNQLCISQAKNQHAD